MITMSANFEYSAGWVEVKLRIKKYGKEISRTEMVSVNDLMNESIFDRIVDMMKLEINRAAKEVFEEQKRNEIKEDPPATG